MVLVMTSVTKKQRNRNKMARCKICARSMRSDHLKRHQRTHANLLAMGEEEIREELRARRDAARHVENHFGIKNFKCMKCDRGFATYQHARYHEERCCQHDVSDSHSGDGESSLTDNGTADSDVQFDLTLI